MVTWQPLAGPGVRVDSGVRQGSVIGPAWDSLLAKLIITGATRQQALQRAARALAEFEIAGLATALSFDRVVVTDPAFAPEIYGQPGPFTVHTRWIETEFDNQVTPWTPGGTETPDGEEDTARQTIVVEVDGKRLQVTLPASLPAGTAPAAGAPATRPRRERGPRTSAGNSAGDTLTAPMQGTVIKVAAEDGQAVKAGDLILVLEAMKMEQPVNAHKDGTITHLAASPGATLTSGAPICDITG